MRVCVCVCMCVCVCVCVIICLVGIIFVYVDMVFGFYGFSFSVLCWIFEHDYVDTCCFECLICMCFVFLYLHLFRAIEYVSHGKALQKYAHYPWNIMWHT